MQIKMVSRVPSTNCDQFGDEHLYLIITDAAAAIMTTSDKLARSRGQGGLRSVRGCWRLYKVMECSHRHGGGRIIDPEI